MPSSQSLQVRAFLIEQVKPALQSATLEELRILLDAPVTATPPDTHTEVVVIEDMLAEWVRVPNADSRKVVLYLHGGGYTCGSVNSHRGFAAMISKASGASVLLIDYRRAPEQPFPAALEDSITAYGWLLEKGFKPESLAIAGDSAGGGLSLATLVALRDRGAPLPAAGVLLSAWTDLAASGASYTNRADYDPLLAPSSLLAQVKLYLGEQDPRKVPLASPLYAELYGLPPLLIHAGQDEILRDDSTQVAEKIEASGGDVSLKVWEGMWHVFQMQWATVPEAQQAVDEIGRFVREKLK